MRLPVSVLSFILLAVGALAAQPSPEPSSPSSLGGLEAAGGAKPGLPGRLPEQGLDASSVRYFPSAADYGAWAKDAGGAASYIDVSGDMEVAQARYADGGRSGTFSLLKFPTPELAEDYYDRLALPAASGADGPSVYARRTGPLVAVLEGDFGPRTADKLLSSVKFGYSVRWIDGESQGKVIWGVPTSILGAVVGSLIFSALAAVGAILIGVAIGAGRFALRGYRERRSPRPVEEDPGFTRLDLR